jgi:protein involved in plasmid replication-relaxation
VYNRTLVLKPAAGQTTYSALTTRERVILETTYHCRLITKAHIQRLFFPTTKSADSARRMCDRTLRRLTNRHILNRLPQRVQEGAAGQVYVYALGSVGMKLLSPGPISSFARHPSFYFVEHTLALTELYVQLHEKTSGKTRKLLSIETEPNCWRRFTSKGGALKPDMFVSLGRAEDEFSCFIELDRGTIHSPWITKKAREYEQYYRTGIEQSLHGVFPQVLWLVSDDRRRQFLETILQPFNYRIPGLFAVTLLDNVIPYLTQAINS